MRAEEIRAQKYDLSFNRYKDVVHGAAEYESPKRILKKLRKLEAEMGIIEQVSAVLRSVFPEMKGFSPSNLWNMRAFTEAWPDFLVGQQAVGELS